MRPRREMLLNIACAASALVVVAVVGMLVFSQMQNHRLRVRESRREAELQQLARQDVAAARTLGAENEIRTSRDLAAHDWSQVLAWILIGGAAGFLATARHVTLFERTSALPRCKRGDKCQVLKRQRG